MKKLHVVLRDCYGIGKLDHVFDFDIHPQAGHDKPEHSQTNIVYARNGVMKTSFAKALYDYSEDTAPVDGLHGRTPHIQVKSDNITFPGKNICVLRSSDEYFETGDMAVLLSNKQDQQRYAEIMLEIETATNELFDVVSAGMGIRGGAEKVVQLFDANFQNEYYNRLAHITSMENEVKNAKPELVAIDYKSLDSPKVTAFLDKSQTQLMLKDYADIYAKVLEQSKYFQDGLFDYGNAFKVQKSLNDNNFMKKGVGNKVVIVTKGREETVIDSIEKLKEEYEKDKNKIFETLEKQAAYDKFDKEINANPDLRGLQVWVRKHKELVPYLQNYKHTKTLVWQAHFAENMQNYDNLLKVYNGHKLELEELIKRSRSYETEWKNIVESFKVNFQPKFDIQVKNHEDVVLKSVKPELVFIYHDDRGGIPKEVSVKVLNEHIFSTGERRALYILCMMFEVRVRMLSGEETLLVLDDIADSFDYKNKYAIIEYLYDISVNHSNKMHMIVLTHNYDFFRLLRTRCQMKWHTSPKAFIAKRNNGVISINGNVHLDEFKRLKQLSTMRALLSLIPLGRNVIEYKQGYQGSDYLLLTAVMHNKSASHVITISQVIGVLQNNLNGTTSFASHASSDPVQDKIISEADNILSDGQDDFLEDKIVLAMGVRLRAERHIKYIYTNDGQSLSDAPHDQTAVWYAQFVLDYPSSSSIQILKRVNIVTPETLHINSFMYEPIIDMPIDELKALYREVSMLSQ